MRLSNNSKTWDVVPFIRQLFVGLVPRKPCFKYIQFHEGLEVDRLALREPLLRFPSASIRSIIIQVSLMLYNLSNPQRR